ncbi:AcrR family transcriptional regulator [Novosphingobium chloroacetimidivorans]|uniref:AcrR family transcriptional regulator n=1 Tax=Novosphingobium chloroacetimidivorans TaxID=1428314 RepID=A0A7W7KC76_9SPHN|nr:TetR/AcrR family transcriptional regulator [Novosphingobium chloroacetimidivorans]MBB4860159.1 AcrR family transcriptional regulator [Novosphingobium chloroacetimidivorans]
MGRRSDHGRDELEALILEAGAAVLAEGGYARFSAREVAKRIGYSVGTVMHVFGNVDRLVMEINARTFAAWTLWLEERLAHAQGRQRILVLVDGYFAFAREHRNLWSAIYEHRLPDAMDFAETLVTHRRKLTGVIAREVAAVLPEATETTITTLTGSLIATVHGHCAFLLGGTFALIGVEHPQALAETRVLEILAANGADLP